MVDVQGVLRRAHGVGHLVGDCLDLRDVRAADAELQRIGHRRAERDTVGAGAHAGEFLRQERAQARDDALAPFQVLAEDHRLREVAAEQLLVEREEVARRAIADIGHPRGHVLIPGDGRLQPLGFLLRGGKARPFRQPELDQDFLAVGVGEELLLREAHADHAEREQAERGQHGQLAVRKAPFEDTPEAMIEARIEDVVAGDGMLVLRPLQDQVAEEGCHDYGGDPGDQQGQAHHGEDAERVLAGSRLRRADGQKTRRRDQRAGEHGESRAAPGEGGGGKLAQALLDLARHHLDGDHGVVDQQAQRDDQRPGGNAVQVDAEVAHAEKGRRHHPGNGDGHHQAGAQAQAEEAHHQHDGQRLEEHAHEVAHRRLDDARLVGHLGELDADRQVGMNRRHFAVEVLAQLEHVAVLDHGHRQADRLLAAEIHLGDRRIDVVAVDPRDVTDAQAASGHRHARVGHRSHRVQFAGDAQGNGMGRGIHGAGRHHGVLRRQRLADSLRIEAQRCQLLLRQLDEDAVVLDADEVDLGDVLQLQQALARRLDMIAQLGMREAVRGESVDGAEDIAELVVVERPDDALRQGAADVADLLAHLVPGVGHRLAARRIVQLEDDE